MNRTKVLFAAALFATGMLMAGLTIVVNPTPAEAALCPGCCYGPSC
jgi:hypothetical protein